MSKGLSIVGYSNNREENDFYPTPSYVIEELLKLEKFEGEIWENACGRGDISKVLINEGYDVKSSDLIDRNYGEVKDFFQYDYISDNIITNPPYKIATQFILEAKKKSRNKIAMFLKTTFLEGQKRKAMFEDKDFPLKTVYQFSKRVSLYKNGIKTKNGGMASYAWFIWDKNYSGKPTIEWI